MLRCVSLSGLVLCCVMATGYGQDFVYSVTGPDAVEGDPGSTVEFEAVIRLRATNLAEGQGVSGWTVALGVDGGATTLATTEGTVVPELSPPGTGFEVTETTSGEGNVGAVSAIVLNVTDPTVVLTSETSEILRVQIDAAVPELEADESGQALPVMGEVILDFFDDIQGGGQPVKNRVAVGGVSFRPAFEGTKVMVLSNDSGVRPLLLNQLAASGEDPDLGGGRVLVFDGELEWGSMRESGSWTGLDLTAAGSGDEGALLESVSLYRDSNGDGRFDAADERLGDAVPVQGDDAVAAFRFASVSLDAGAPVRFFVVAQVTGESNSANAVAAWLLPLGLAAFAVRRREGASSRVLLLGCACLGLALPLACSSGGSSGGSREVRFDLATSEAVLLEGADTGIRGVLDNLPVEGPEVDV